MREFIFSSSISCFAGFSGFSGFSLLSDSSIPKASTINCVSKPAQSSATYIVLDASCDTYLVFSECSDDEDVVLLSSVYSSHSSISSCVSDSSSFSGFGCEDGTGAISWM